MKFLKILQKFMKKKGSDCWFSDDPQKFLEKNIKQKILKN